MANANSIQTTGIHTHTVKMDFYDFRTEDKSNKRKHHEIEKEEEENNGPSFFTELWPAHRHKKKECKQPLTDTKLKQLEQEKINHFRNVHNINTIGTRIPNPISEFTELSTIYNVPERLVDNVINCGYKQPTAVQMQVLPTMLQGRQVLAHAPTGSGKTAAFLLPIMHYLNEPQEKGFRAVILNPTRELAKQTYREYLRLSKGYNLRVHVISKTNRALEKFKSSQKFDMLITTPNTVVHLLNQDPPAISLNNVEWLIVDEADKFFEEGQQNFRDQLETILKACTNENLKRAMFSATSTHKVTRWCRKNLKGLVTVTVGHRNTPTDSVEQELRFVDDERGQVFELVCNIIPKGILTPCIIFVNRIETAIKIYEELRYRRAKVIAADIHANMTQTERDKTVRDFREGKISILICTELMARGIDFKGVNLVINYDFPPSANSYIHRIGRTGRAGHTGKAITFFTKEDFKKPANLRSIATIIRESGGDVPEYIFAMRKRNKKEEWKGNNKKKFGDKQNYKLKQKKRNKKSNKSK